MELEHVCATTACPVYDFCEQLMCYLTNLSPKLNEFIVSSDVPFRSEILVKHIAEFHSEDNYKD